MTDRLLLLAIFNEAQQWSLPEALVEKLRAHAPPGVKVEAVNRRATLMERLPEAEFLVGLPLAESQFTGRTESLRFVQLVTAWAESLAPFRAAIEAGARVAGTAAIRAETVAEHTMALLLAMLRRIDVAVLAQSNRRWTAAPIGQQVRDLAGATVGILNIDIVGREIAKRLRPFGCEIIATGDDPEAGALVDRLLSPAHIDKLVSVADVIIIADGQGEVAPPVLTRALFDEMRPSTFLINVASGCAFAEAELLRAIRRGRIAGAALDCYEHRPLPRSSPLWNASNVLLTPSIGTASPSYWRRAIDVTIENLRRFEAGEPLLDELTSQTPASVGGR